CTRRPVAVCVSLCFLQCSGCHLDLHSFPTRRSSDLYLLRPAIVLLGSAEEAIRLPSEAETFGDVGENIVENTGLQPEVSSNYNAGFKIGPYKIKEHKISLGGSVFLRDTKDKIVRRSNTRINDAEQVAPFENLAKTKSKGFEAEFMYQF